MQRSSLIIIHWCLVINAEKTSTMLPIIHSAKNNTYFTNVSLILIIVWLISIFNSFAFSGMERTNLLLYLNTLKAPLYKAAFIAPWQLRITHTKHSIQNLFWMAFFFNVIHLFKNFFYNKTFYDLIFPLLGNNPHFSFTLIRSDL